MQVEDTVGIAASYTPEAAELLPDCAAEAHIARNTLERVRAIMRDHAAHGAAPADAPAGGGAKNGAVAQESVNDAVAAEAPEV